MARLLAFLLMLVALPARAVTGIYLEGETGAILDAQRVVLDAGNGSVTASRSGAAIVVQWDRAAGRSEPAFTPYRFILAGIDRGALTPGDYADARSLIANVPGYALFDLNAGCNGESRTNFTVRELQFGAGGEVLKLAVDFVAYCGFSTRPLRGELRIDSTLPLVTANPAARAGADRRVPAGTTVSLDASASASSDGSALAYSWRQVGGTPVTLQDATSARPSFVAPSTRGEYEFLEFEVSVTDGPGRKSTDRTIVTVTTLVPRNVLAYQTPREHPNGQLDLTFDLAQEYLQLRRNLRSGIYVGYTGELRGPTGSFGDFWLDVAAPNAATIRAGNFFPAYRTGFAPPGHAGFDYSLGIGCGVSVTSYVVHEAAYDEFGRVERLALDFDTDCLETTRAAGQLRINSVVPLRSRLPHANAGPDLVMFTGQTVALDASLSSGGTSSLTRTTWRQVSGPAVALRPGATESEVLFDAPALPPGGGELTFEVRVENAAGYDDTDVVKVTILGQTDPRSWVFLQVPPNQGRDFVTQLAGGSLFLTVNEGSFVPSRGSTIPEETLLVDHIAETRTAFYFQLQPGQRLQTGRVYRIEPGLPRPIEMRVSREARGCNAATGRFVVHELRYSAVGQPTAAAVDFIQYCDNGPPLYGFLRYQSSVPAIAPTPTASAGYDQQAVGNDNVRLSAEESFAGPGISRYEWVQVSGPPVTLDAQAANAYFDAPASGGTFVFRVTAIAASGATSSDEVTVTVLPAGSPRSALLLDSPSADAVGFGTRGTFDLGGAVQVLGSTANEAWINLGWGNPSMPGSFQLRLHAPFDDALGPGNYPGLRDVIADYRRAHDIRNAPGMGFDWRLFGCADSRGSFHVREYQRTPAGGLDRLAVDFALSCGLDGPITRAAVRVNSSIPLRAAIPVASAGPDQVVGAGASVQLDGRYSIAWQGNATTYRWRQTGGTPVAISNERDTRPQFTAPRPAAADELLTFELAVTDARGNVATDAVSVRVLAPQSPRSTARLTVRDRATGSLIGEYAYDVNNAYPKLTAPEASIASVVFLGAEELTFALDPDAQPGKRLQTGSWTTTTASPSGPPRLRVTVPGQPPFACADNLLESTRLDIADARYGVASLEDLAFAFVQVCRDITISGAVQYHSAATVSAPDAQADAGSDQGVLEATTVTLTGTGVGTGGRAPTLAWRQLSGPTVRLDTRDRGIAAFVAPPVSVDTKLIFELSVDDGTRILSDTVEVTVRDNGIAGFQSDVLVPRPAAGARALGLRGTGTLVDLAVAAIATGGSGGDVRPRDAPYGALTMTFAVPAGGSQAAEFVLADEAAPGARWVRYAPETNTWQRFDGSSSFSGDRRTLTVTFVDGGNGDEDGLANGRIVVKGTVGVYDTAPAPGAGGGSGSSGSSGGGGGIDPRDIMVLCIALALLARGRRRAGRASPP